MFICIFVFVYCMELKAFLKEISIGCRKKEAAGLPPDNDLCFVKFQSMILSPVADQLPLLPSLLLRCSSTTFNLGSNCRTKLISYSNVRLGGEALRPTPTAHLTLSITVSSSCNSLNTAAISTLAPNPAVARRHLTKYGKFNYVYR